MRRYISVPLLLTAACAGLVAGITGITPALVLSGAAWRQRITVDPTGAVALAAGSLLWLLLVGVAAGVLASVVALLPGLTGRMADAAARRITPALIRRAVHTLVGVSMAATAIVPGAALASTATRPHSGDLGRVRAAHSVTAPAQVSLGTPLPPLGEPGGTVTEAAPVAPPPKLAAAPRAAPTLQPAPARPPAAGPASPSGRADQVTVQAGDTLWELADRSLGGHADPTAIARTWPLWWAANRAAIGVDPDLLLPGEVLHAP